MLGEQVFSVLRARRTEDLIFAGSEGRPRAGMAEVANSVIHNVGNALNSINVAVSTINSEIKSTPLGTLPKIADMLKEHETNLSEFLSQDEKGQKIPKLLEMLSDQWKLENATLISETKNEVSSY